MNLDFTREERQFIYDQAYIRLRRAGMGVRGQAFTERDGLEYWVHYCTIDAIKHPEVFFKTFVKENY